MPADLAAVLDAGLQQLDGSVTTLRAQLTTPVIVVVFLRHFG